MSRYIRIILLITLLLATSIEVLLEYTQHSFSPTLTNENENIHPYNPPRIEPYGEPDTSYSIDYSTDNLGMNYFPNNDNFDQDYDYTPLKQNSGTVRIPVLTYHNIAELPAKGIARDYYVSPEMFEQQLIYLKSKNYRTLTPTEFYTQLVKGQNPTQKSVMLTFDDGNYNNYKNAFPLLKKYGFIGVFYVNSNRLGINSIQLKEMADAGMIIDSHGSSHIDLTKEINAGTLWSEINGSKTKIQNITKKNIVSFSYPGCAYNARAVADVKAAGYLIAFTCGSSIDHKANARLALSRMHVYNDLENFKKRLSGIWEYPAGYSN